MPSTPLGTPRCFPSYDTLKLTDVFLADRAPLAASTRSRRNATSASSARRRLARLRASVLPRVSTTPETVPVFRRLSFCISPLVPVSITARSLLAHLFCNLYAVFSRCTSRMSARNHRQASKLGSRASETRTAPFLVLSSRRPCSPLSRLRRTIEDAQMRDLSG